MGFFKNQNYGAQILIFFYFDFENVALLVVSVYTESEELVRLYHWFLMSKRSLSDVTQYRTFSCTDGCPLNLPFASSYQRFNNV